MALKHYFESFEVKIFSMIRRGCLKEMHESDLPVSVCRNSSYLVIISVYIECCLITQSILKKPSLLTQNIDILLRILTGLYKLQSQ